MASYNRIIMIGNLTRDPEYKQLTSGQPVTRLGLACNRQYKNKVTGAMVQEVCFIDIDVFGPQAESCRQYLQKGRPVLIEGRLKFDTWQTQDGQTRSKHSIVADRVVFLGNGSMASESESEMASLENNTASNIDLNDPNISAAHEKLGRIQNKKKTNAYSSNFAQEENDGIVKSGGELDFKDEPPFQDLPF